MTSRTVSTSLGLALAVAALGLPSTAAATNCKPVGGTSVSAPDRLAASNTGCLTAQRVSRACLNRFPCTGINQRTTFTVNGRRWRCSTKEASFAGSRTVCLNMRRYVRFDLYSGH